MDAFGNPSTYAGTGASGGNDGPVTSAFFNDLVGISIDLNRQCLYVSDGQNDMIRKIFWVMPLTVNAPAMGKRLNSQEDVHYYTFTIDESRSYNLNVSTGKLFSSFNVEVFGPDDDYDLL